MGTREKWVIIMGRKSAKVFIVSEDGAALKWLRTIRNPLGGERNREMNHDKPVFGDIAIAAESHMLGLVKKTFRKEKIPIDVEWIKKDLDKLTVKKIEKIVFHNAASVL